LRCFRRCRRFRRFRLGADVNSDFVCFLWEIVVVFILVESFFVTFHWFSLVFIGFRWFGLLAGWPAGAFCWCCCFSCFPLVFIGFRWFSMVFNGLACWMAGWMAGVI
jgi:hypothetical protein